MEHARDRGHDATTGAHPRGQPRVRGDARRRRRRLRRAPQRRRPGPGVAGQGAPSSSRRLGREGQLRVTTDHVRLDGSVFPAETEAITTVDRDGRPLHRMSWSEDLTEQAGGRGRAPRDRRDVRGGVRPRAQRRRHDRARRTLPACQRRAVRHARPRRSRARRASDDRGLPPGRPRRHAWRVRGHEHREPAGVDREALPATRRRGRVGLLPAASSCATRRRAELHRHALRRLHGAQARRAPRGRRPSCASSARSPTRRSAWRSSTSTAPS